VTTAAVALAAQWTTLWHDDLDAMVRDIYAPNVIVEHAGHGPRSRVVGRDELMVAEQQLLALIPDHRNEVVRVLDGGDGRAVVESVVTGSSPGDTVPQACPTIVWWWLDENDQVAREVAYWEWRKRVPAHESVAGTVVPGAGPALTLDEGRAVARKLAELWSDDPVAMATTMYAAETVAERLGEGATAVLRGRDVLAAAEADLLLLLPSPQRRMKVHDVLVDGRAIAIAFTIEASWRGTGPHRRGPGALVLTLDADGLIASDRIYWHWDMARETA
jgi:hypothetical protein